MTEQDKDNARDSFAMYGNVLVKDGRVLNSVERQNVDLYDNQS